MGLLNYPWIKELKKKSEIILNRIKKKTKHTHNIPEYTEIVLNEYLGDFEK